MRQVKAPGADISVVIRIVDSTDGTPETGVVAATAGLSLNYRREGGLLVNIASLSDLALLTTAHTDGGLLHIGHGYYRLDVPDAAFAAGVDGVLVEGTATGMVVIGTYVQLVGYDPRTELTAAVLARIDENTSAAKTLTAAYNAAKTAAQAGNQMDLVNAPNATAILAIQSGLAIPGSLMGLANDAITAGKFDESTAWPLLAADAAATQIARVGADADTLETLSDQLDAVKIDTAATLSDTGTDGVALAADSIKKVTFDETTAWPILAADTGTTQIARVGADADTLETLSDQLDGVEPADVWANAERTLTQSATAVTAAVSGSTITIHRGDSLSAALTGLGNISTRTKLWFTIKTSRDDADTAAIIQIEETAGLLYLNGAAGTAANGDITVDSATAGNITVTLDEVETANLALAGDLHYDVQMKTATAIQTLTTGSCNITRDVTRATS